MSMTFKPLLANHTTVDKPPSAFKKNSQAAGLALLRDSFTLSTWLLIGAALQCLLFALPVRPVYKFGPPLFLLALRLATNMLQIARVLPNPQMAGVLHAKATAVFPPADGSYADERKTPGGSDVCVILVTTRSNHPLGMLEHYQRTMGTYFTQMMAELERDPAAHGWLGGKMFLASERAAANEIMTLLYFTGMDALQRFAHGPAHRAGWSWFVREMKHMPHVSIAHEAFHAPAGSWEGVYKNSAPTGLGATAHRVAAADGASRWQSPLVDARGGRLRTSKGRLGATQGGENDAYGDVLT